MKSEINVPLENIVWPPGCQIQYPNGRLTTPEEFTWDKNVKPGPYQVWGPHHEDWGVIQLGTLELN
jgi:hypothetical protein